MVVDLSTIDMNGLTNTSENVYILLREVALIVLHISYQQQSQQ